VIEAPVLERVLAEALRHGGQFAEVFAEDRSTSSVVLDDRRLEDLTSGRERGAGIRVVVGETTGFAHTADLSEAGLLAAAAAAAAAANPAPVEGLPLPPGVPTAGGGPTPAPGDLTQDFAALRACESGDNYSANTGNGYYGAYQFALSTWLGLGYSGLPSAAPPATQNAAAYQLYQQDGWSPWPACSAMLGL